MRVLVTGGAGYVGSVSVERFVEAGHDVVVIDSLATGHRRARPEGARLVEGDSGNAADVERILREHGIEAVLHCAARSLVGQSMQEPALYYGQNVVGGIALLDGMRAAGVDRLVFSSSAAVYGAPDVTPIPEDATLRPISPYGETKRVFEGALGWYGVHGLRSVALRYFNAAGASEQFGEDHDPETHLIPNVLRAYLDGPPLTVMGTDYPTPDGTPIRDYVHVVDVADAHLAALERTATAEPGLLLANLGSGRGFSVREVLTVAESIVGRPVPHEVGERRAGDPPVLVASNERARDVLGWAPQRSTLEEMIGSAWAWRSRNPNGYGD